MKLVLQRLFLIGTMMAFAGCDVGNSKQGHISDVPLVANKPSIEKLCSAKGVDGLALQVPSPEWRDQIIYMLMIDRFNDANPDINDFSAGEYDRFKETHFNGGDIEGITEKIPYLKNLGVSAIWMTPPVYNQWWSNEYQAAGWHGYWATHFNKIDPHFGTKEDYKQLSHELHCNEMYLIQDIVVNHVGNFYNYKGEYDPSDTAKGFFMIEEGHPTQEAPEQYPFNMIDRLNPEHATADIYHWTPPVFDYNDKHQELNYGLGTIADINTENPVVIEKFKDVYGNWIKEVGVDAFRVDTVMLVPPEFFEKFLHDDNGIYAKANALGKDHFLTFGEVIGISKPYETSGEKKITQYMTNDKAKIKGFNSMLGYPLYYDIKGVLSGGKPTSHLAFRLDAFMKEYPDPFVIPTFVDNHDTTRFMTTGSKTAFRQALALIMTIPGIPIILQGTEQLLRETRQTMFGPAQGSKEDNFKLESEQYKYLQKLIKLRKDNKVLTRGSMTQLASSEISSGILAFKREYEGETALIIFNSAEHSIYVKDLESGLAANHKLRMLYSQSTDDSIVTAKNGLITMELPGRAFWVATDKGAISLTDSAVTNLSKDLNIKLDNDLTSEPYSEDIKLSGTSDIPKSELQLVINGNLDETKSFITDSEGKWKTTIFVQDYGHYTKTFQIYSAEYQFITDPVTYTTEINKPTFQQSKQDANDDAKGPKGSYIAPQHRDFDNQVEITGVSVQGAGAGLELTISVINMTDIWLPPNGFDNVTYQIFMDLPNRTGTKVLPMINADMPNNKEWDIGHLAHGWFNFLFKAEGSSADHRGDIIVDVPLIEANKEEKTVKITYDGSAMGVDDWTGTRIYITTWDISAEAMMVPLRSEPSAWHFGGGLPNDPKIMDDIEIVIE